MITNVEKLLDTGCQNIMISFSQHFLSMIFFIFPDKNRKGFNGANSEADIDINTIKLAI